MAQKEFQIEEHDGADKSFRIIPPNKWNINLIVDYDDVDHDKIDAEAAKIINLLNQQANPVENRVSFAEPNQQLFTVAEINELLEEQKSICARESKVRYIHKKANLDKQAKIFRDDSFEQSWTTDERTIVNAPPPQKFIDRIIVKS